MKKSSQGSSTLLPAVGTYRKAMLSATPDKSASGFFFNLNVTLGTILFLPSTMPASYQPLLASVDFERLLDVDRAAARRGAATRRAAARAEGTPCQTCAGL
jgi:hypothetical protein